MAYDAYDYADRRYASEGPPSVRLAGHIVYGLYALSLFTGVPAFFGAIVAYVKRGDARGTVYESHYSHAIRTFWWGLFWFVIGSITTFILIGWVILGLLWLWFLWRTARGWLRLIDARPI